MRAAGLSDRRRLAVNASPLRSATTPCFSSKLRPLPRQGPTPPLSASAPCVSSLLIDAGLIEGKHWLSISAAAEHHGIRG
jgi:hypothetical protein